MTRLYFYLCIAIAVLLLVAESAYAAETVVPGSTVSHEVCKPEPGGEGEECETIEEWETSSTTETTIETVTSTEEAVPPAPLALVPVVKHHKPSHHHKHHHKHHHAR
jgi:hypothetical protein